MNKLYLFTPILSCAILLASVATAQNISTYMGNGSPGGADGTQHNCSIRPFAMFMGHNGHANGNLFVSDHDNYRIRELSVDTSVHYRAGSASPGFTGVDGSNATIAQINMPAGIWCDSTGDTVLFCDMANNAVRMLTFTGIYYKIYNIVNTSGVAGFAGDGATATTAKLTSPTGIWRDAAHNIYIADRGNHCIRKVDHASGFINTVAGIGGTIGDVGDGVSATSGGLHLPTSVFVDSIGNIYIADQGNHKVRKIDVVTHNITTIAGTGTPGSAGDLGAATSAELDSPSGVYVFAGKTYIADKGNNKVRVVNSSGIISTFAGTGTVGGSGDGGLATSAQLYRPTSVFANNNGVYISDYGNNKIRYVQVPNAVKSVQQLDAYISPNPSTGSFIVQLPATISKAHVAVYNMVGSLIYSSTVSEKFAIDLSAQPNGVYSLHLSAEDAASVQKIVIAH